MTTKNNNYNSFAPYKGNEEVETLLAQSLNNFEIEKLTKLLDEGLESKLYITNPEGFQKIVDNYLRAKNL